MSHHLSRCFLPTLLLLAPACSDGGAAVPTSPSGAPAAAALTAPPLQPFQLELLRLAFRAASAFPLDPHGKNRSRAQEVVVAGCFQIEQPQLALELAQGIADWRRGCAEADYAGFCARRGQRDEALAFVARAEKFATELAAGPNAQLWRRDLILAKLARACRLLGDPARADQLAARIDAASSNAVDPDQASTLADRALLLTEAEVGNELAAMHAAFPTMSLGQQHTAVLTLLRVHERFFDVAAHRTVIEQRIAVGYDKLPPLIRLSALAQLAATCLEKNDQATARSLLATARRIAAAHTWRPADQVPQLARLAELRARAGEVDEARADAEAAFAIYHRERDSIVNIDRAEALRPLALAWHALGETATADGMFAQALEEAMENPNSRPRADDLVDTAVVMATHRIEPSPQLWTRMREICEGLGNPW
ncbi:MAG TPA: hypothetical protein VF384_20195 [Planctomycetota bacterium]